MVDIATVWNAEISRGDYAVAPGGALESDQDLFTATLLSLFTDLTAQEDDTPPDGGGRRGWWGNAYLRYPLGSWLWLLSREKETETTRMRAEVYARGCIAWMIEAGVASDTLVAAAWTGPGRLELTVVIVSPNGRRQGWRFALAWGQLVSLDTVTGLLI